MKLQPGSVKKYVMPIRKSPANHHRRTRNRLVHGYLGIDDDIVWNIACNDVFALLALPPELLETTGSN